MKKLCVWLLVLVLFLPAAASAAVDLSGMTFEELIALRAEVDAALWASEDWQSVNVPEGGYVVGRDIPAGHWTITAAEKAIVRIKVGAELDSTGADLAANPNYSVNMTGRSTSVYKEGSTYSIDIILNDGDCIVIDSGEVIFTPFVGKSLGFK